MKSCPVCGKDTSETAPTCPDCGYAFAPPDDSQKTRIMPTAPSGLGPGSRISDRYEVIRELGRGGMGSVYLVRDSKLRGRELALKMIHPELVAHEEARQRFKDEVILCLDLLHPNIIRIYNLEEWENNLYFTMAFIQGKSLRELMATQSKKGRIFTLEETLKVAVQVLEALSYAHRMTIHRDIKPENLLVQGEFPDISVTVLDFGIAKVLSASRFTRTDQSMGTAYYMSPEQMQGAAAIDHRSDLYSVGMILYEMLTGRIAAGRFRLPAELIPDLPQGIDPLMEKALSPEPENRFDSAEEMKAALLGLMEDGPLPARPETPAPSKSEDVIKEIPQKEKKSEPRKSRTGMVLVFLAILICAAGLGGYQLLTPGKGGEPPGNTIIKGIKSIAGTPEPILTVNTDPPGSDVYVDEGHAGQGPVTVETLSPGTHKVRVTRKRYKEVTKNVFIQEGHPRNITATLVPLPFGDLKVDSTPSGALVFIDGEQKGETPFFMENLEKGGHEIRVEKKDYESFKQMVSIAPLETTALSPELKYSFGSLSVASTPAGAKVFIDGVQKGETHLNIEKIKTGFHRIKVSRSCYTPQEKEIAIAPEMHQTVSFDLAAACGSIAVKGRPDGAQLSLDGRPAGKLPETLSGVASGRHTLEISKRGFKTQSKTVQVAPAREEAVRVDLEKRPPKAGDTWTDALTGMKFMYVSPGCFDMGSASGESDEKPVHKVCLDGFWMGKYEVTQGQWKKIMGSNPSRFKSGDDYPVEQVSWNDVQKFIKELNEKSSHGFALPSEAQWEYAARSGGKDETYSGGEDIDRVAWYSMNIGRKTHRVGTRAGNGLGIHDMSGNVWEWCEDVYDDNAYSKPEHGRKNPLVTSGGSNRVRRGGGWLNLPAGVRCAYRNGYAPSRSSVNLGFRLIRRN